MADPEDKISPATDQHAERVANPMREKAAEFLASHGSGEVTFTYEEEKKVINKIDRRVLVLLLGAYFFQQLDKSSLKYGKRHRYNRCEKNTD